MPTSVETIQALRLSYPGMMPREALIWRTWLFANSMRFTRYEYNVRLGTGTDPGPSYEMSARRQWIANTMKRLDVLAVSGGRVTIIEVEENPGLSAFGQVAGYLSLWRARIRNGGPPPEHIQLGVENFFPRDLPKDSDPALLMVVARASNDALTVAQSSGVRVEVVLTDFTVLKPGGK